MIASRFFQIAGLAMIAGLAGCSDEKTATQQPIRPVKVLEVRAPDHAPELTYSGSVRARNEIPMGFRVDGKVTERLADVGQRVKPGDVLAKVDATDYQLSVHQAEAELSSAEKQVEISALALKRAQTLQSQSITPQSSLEQAQLASQQAIAARDAAQSALQQARNRVAYTVLTADVDGIVTSVSAEAGQVLAAGTPAVTVAGDGAKEVVVAVPETEIGQFAPGKSVKASFWFDRTLVLDGKVREVAGSADAQSRTFSVRVSLPNDPRVRLGVTAIVTAATEQKTAAFVLPLTALAKQNDKPIVWVVDRATRKVSPRSIEVDGFVDDGVQVTGGLAAGDLVVAAGTQFMQPDLEVRLGTGDDTPATSAAKPTATPNS